MNITNLPTYYQQFIHKSRYARWIESENRREEWDETISRYMAFMSAHLMKKHDYKIDNKLYHQLYEAIVKQDIMPSMRCVMTAGKALERDNTAGYNCSYLPVDDPKSFDEAMYILMCGTGVGFSVERNYVNKLPEVPEQLFRAEEIIIVNDSKEGWAKALRKLLALLWSGEIPNWDLSRVRPAGSILKTFGGRASGPAPLESLFKFIVMTFKNAKGRKLSSLECHDIMCKVGEVVVSGGVRRSAMISLSNLSDDRMRHAKTGEFYKLQPQRQMSNNSVAYTEKPDMKTFMREWLSLAESGTGERGMFYRGAAQNKAQENGRRDSTWDFGTNPCSEIILRPYQFCNLSEVIVRGDDSIDDISKKVELATILGTFQSTLTNFPYLRKIWQKNTEEERLLGVSMTGILDNSFMSGAKNVSDLKNFLMHLRDVTKEVNKEWAEFLNISPSASITCIKPEGTTSCVAGTSSGLHPRHSKHYIRRVRLDTKDPIGQLMIDAGVPHEPCVMRPDNTMVFSFPVQSPTSSICQESLGAIRHLELWELYQIYYCDHKPSITISYTDDEFLSIGAWVWDRWNWVSGISFLPKVDHVYEQAPFEEVNSETYSTLLDAMPEEIDWSKLSEYEKEDETKHNHTLACSSGSCEIT
jgi:ribonucleoside-diphosphate reductase alpha chain